MMRKYLLCLLLATSFSFAEDINTVGIVSTGAIGNEGSGASGNFRGSSGFEAYRPYATISCFDSSISNTASECALVFGAFDSSGTKRKTASDSVMWVDNSLTNGFAVRRHNVTFQNNGVPTDDIYLRGFGNHGATFFGVAENDWFGYKTLGVRGQIYVAYGQQVDGTDFFLTSQFRSPDYTKGVVLGYNNATGSGVIHCAASPCGDELWVHNGFYRFKAFGVDQNGKIEMSSANLTPTYNGGAPQYINIKINGQDYQLIAYKKP